MLSIIYNRADRCAYIKDSGSYVGTLYRVYSTDVKTVGAYKKVTFKNEGGIPLMLLFCEYSELEQQDVI